MEVLHKGSVRDEACTIVSTKHVPGSIEVMCHGTRIQAVCRSMVPGEDLELVSQSAALIRTKSWTRRAMGRLIHELGEWFPTCLKVRNESSMSACQERQLGAPPVKPVLVNLVKASKSIVDAKP